MTQGALSFDAAQSTVTVETRAKGMFAKLAHDLSIDAKELSASSKIEGGSAHVELRVPVGRLEVAGVLKGTVLDRSVLSRSDRDDIQKKIRAEVLTAVDVVVSMQAPVGDTLEVGRRSIEASGRVEIGARSTRVTSRCSIDVSTDRVTAEGRVKVSLPSLGITPPKGPLGAFRVDDDVEIVYRLVFDRAARARGG